MIYTLRMFKAWGGRVASQQWCNTYHINVNEGELTIEDEAWLTLANALVEQEGTFHLTEVNFMRAVVSTTLSEPVYDPRSLRVIELVGGGQRNRAAEDAAAPLDIALKCKKNVSFGRSGTMFYRGCLKMSDITTQAGGNLSIKAPIDNSLTSSVNNIFVNLQDELTALGGSFCMAPKNGTAAEIAKPLRNWQGLAVSGLSINKRDHAWFDRKPKSATPAPGEVLTDFTRDDDGDGIANEIDPDSEFYIPPSTDD